MDIQVESRAKSEVDASAQPSYQSLHHIAVAALWQFHRTLGRSEKYISNALGTFNDPDPSKFPSRVPFPLEDLTDDSLWFLIGYTPKEAPFSPALQAETERRLGENPEFSKPPLQSLLLDPNFFEQIAYNGQK